MEIEPTFENRSMRIEAPATLVDPPVVLNIELKNPARDRRRAKSSLRLKYEAEKHVIERKIGDLEFIREKLGLTQRKMAQLLLVDPSAWTRWTKGDDEAPPHIYRMLQWYLALEEKYPVLDVNFWLNTVAQVPNKSGVFAEQVRVLETDLASTRARFEALEQNLEMRERTMKRWFAAVLFVTALVSAFIGFSAAT